MIALAVFIQLQEAMEAKVIYLQPDVKAKYFFQTLLLDDRSIGLKIDHYQF